MVVSNWSPKEDESKAKLVPLWVHLTNVPMNMYSWEGLSFITSAAGIPDHLHPETLACTNFDIAKVFVHADLSKELPRRIDYTIQGEKVTVEFKYPWLPPKCKSCEKWGHNDLVCKMNKNDGAGSQKSPEKKEEVQKEKEVEIQKEETEQKESGRETEKEEGLINEDWKTT